MEGRNSGELAKAKKDKKMEQSKKSSVKDRMEENLIMWDVSEFSEEFTLQSLIGYGCDVETANKILAIPSLVRFREPITSWKLRRT